MKELSLHILDIAQNSISAGARALDLTLAEENGWLTITVADDGRGMSPEFLATVTDPFTTTRTTRKVVVKGSVTDAKNSGFMPRPLSPMTRVSCPSCSVRDSSRRVHPAEMEFWAMSRM